MGKRNISFFITKIKEEATFLNLNIKTYYLHLKKIFFRNRIYSDFYESSYFFDDGNLP